MCVVHTFVRSKPLNPTEPFEKKLSNFNRNSRVAARGIKRQCCHKGAVIVIFAENEKNVHIHERKRYLNIIK